MCVTFKMDVQIPLMNQALCILWVVEDLILYLLFEAWVIIQLELWEITIFLSYQCLLLCSLNWRDLLMELFVTPLPLGYVFYLYFFLSLVCLDTFNILYLLVLHYRKSCHKSFVLTAQSKESMQLRENLGRQQVQNCLNLFLM